jgi:hypothetical protein
LFPQLAGVSVERVFMAGKSVRIRARTSDLASNCPACGVASRRVHSRYERRLADTAAGGQEPLIRLQVRRFFCRNDVCGRTTFAEQVPGLTSRYARRNERGKAMLRLLQVNAVGAGQLPDAAVAVPSHCVGIVVLLARQYAKMWHDFALDLNDRAWIIDPSAATR